MNNVAIMIKEDTQHRRFLTFSLDAETFAIETYYVFEIIRIQPIISEKV